jgi:hypothetical protein
MREDVKPPLRLLDEHDTATCYGGPFISGAPAARTIEVLTMSVRLAFMLSMWIVASPAWAQFDTGTVLGVVRDSSGAVLPGTTITLLNTATGVLATKVTDERGAYEFFTVRAGDYTVRAELPGFAPQAAEVKVEVGGRQRIDVELRVGAIEEAVTVSGEAPRIETDSSQRGQVITGDQTRALPLNGREYSALALLTTGVKLGSSNLTTGGTPREGTFNVNGLRSTFNNFLIDGVDNNAYGTSNQGFSNQVMQPPPDAVGEFKVVTNNMSAEYGRAAGATVNVVYQSGTNRLHGSGWEFFRDTALNATGFFKPANGQKPPLERNQFGGVIGGPILKNRAFFFADYEGFRQTRESAVSSVIPSPRQRQGILSVAAVDPRNGRVYPAGVRIPMTAFAQRVLSALPDTPDGGNNYPVFQEFTNDTDKAGGKIDIQISPALSLFGRYGWRDLETFDQPNIPLPSGGDGNGTIYAQNKQLALGATFVPDGRSLVEFRFGWSTTRAGKNPPALGSTSALESFGIPGLPADPRISGGLPSQVINGFNALGRQQTNPQWQYPTVWNPKVNYSRLLSRHSVKAGYEFQRIETEVQDVNPLYGRDTYNGSFTRPTGAPASNEYNLADFMLGLRAQYALSNVLIANLRQHMHFLYTQDDWRVTDRLTLNLGLRYEYATPHWERDNVLTNYDPVSRKMVAATDGSLSERALVDPDRNNFGPRLGFAWTVADRTVVRGGYGISYTHFNRAGGGNILPINAPQSISAVVNQALPNLANGTFRSTEEGYPDGLTDSSQFNPLLANITYMPRDYHSSRAQSWFLSLQRELGMGMMVDVAYVANRADDLLLFANLNQATPNNAAGTLSLQQRRPIQEFADITYAFNGGKSRYHSLQTKLDWRLNRDLTILSSLTLSRAKDNGAGSLEGPNGNFPAPQDYYNLDADFGLSPYHQPYNSTTSFVWALPFGRGHQWASEISRGLDLLVGGWQVAGISTVYAGEPVTFRYNPAPAFQVSGIVQDFRGANNYRPNVTGDPYASGGAQTITNWFNRDNVTIPTDPSQPFGNAARNSVRGPLFWQVDLAASKQVSLTADARIELRIEAFNLLNRTNFRAPDGNRSNGSFGTITQTFDARQMQLGVKLIW